ncbi:MAG: hypothetical protein RLY86_1599, partial [Pseudomonadota bacterium]
MRPLPRLVLAAALIAALVPGTGQAGGTPVDLVSLGAGRFDVVRNSPRDQAADLRLEYRPVL